MLSSVAIAIFNIKLPNNFRTIDIIMGFLFSKKKKEPKSKRRTGELSETEQAELELKQAKRAVQSKLRSERCERTSELKSECPSINVPIFGCSAPL